MQRRGVADRRDPEEADLALLAQPLERRHHLVEHLPDAQRRSAAGLGNRIVQMKDVDPVKPQPRQTAFERRRDGVGNAAELAGRQPDLGADDRVGRLQLLQNAAEILFRFAVAVLHRGVEIIHAGVERPRDGALLVGGIAAHHQCRRPRRSQNPAPRAAFPCAQRPAIASLFLRLAGGLCRVEWPLLNLDVCGSK